MPNFYALLLCLLIVLCFLFPTKQSELISIFPIEHYDQNISHWIKPTDADYDVALLTPAQQQFRKQELIAKYFGARSPWSQEHIHYLLSVEDLVADQKEKLYSYDNENKSKRNIQYGSN